MLKLGDIMTKKLFTLAPEQTLRDAMEVLASHHVSGCPVVTATGTPVGVVSASDLIMFAAGASSVPMERDFQRPYEDETESEPEEEDEEIKDLEDGGGVYFNELWSTVDADVTERLTAVEGTEWNVFEEHTVEEVMTRTLLTRPSETSVVVAADFMRKNGVHRILVVDEGQLVGIVTTMDIVRAVAEGKLTSRVFVFGEGDKRQRPPKRKPAT